MGFWDIIEKITETAADKAADGLDRAVRHAADDLDKTTTQGHGISIWGVAPPPPKPQDHVNWWGEKTATPKKERSIWDAPGADGKGDKDKGGFSWW